MSVQASWVCQCDGMLVQRLEADFKVTLQQQNSLEDWATWLKNVVSVVLKPYQGKPNFTKAARQFLLKWSFYRWEHDNLSTVLCSRIPNLGIESVSCVQHFFCNFFTIVNYKLNLTWVSFLWPLFFLGIVKTGYIFWKSCCYNQLIENIVNTY